MAAVQDEIENARQSDGPGCLSLRIETIVIADRGGQNKFKGTTESIKERSN